MHKIQNNTPFPRFLFRRERAEEVGYREISRGKNEENKEDEAWNRCFVTGIEVAAVEPPLDTRELSPASAHAIVKHTRLFPFPWFDRVFSPGQPISPVRHRCRSLYMPCPGRP